MPNSCNICNHKTLNHSKHIICKICKSYGHINCLPYVNRNDSIYTERESNNWYCTRCTESIFPFNNIYEDDDFYCTLAENFHSDDSIDFNSLEFQNKCLSPFELNAKTNSPFYDNDPDLQFLRSQYNNNILTCEYFLENSFNQEIKKKGIKNECLSMLHQNIRSAPKNLKNLECFLSNLSIDFKFLGLSETWFKDHNADLHAIAGYKAVHNYRKNKSGGGVSILIRDDIEFIIKPNLTVMTPELETIFIEVKKGQAGNHKDMLIGVIYRPPGTDLNIARNKLEHILDKIKVDKKLVYLLGDYNANIINYDKHTPTQELLDLFYSYLLLPFITKPTRVTTKSATLIDNIFCNDISNISNIFSGILYSDVSDHFPIFFIDNNKRHKKENKYLFKRTINQENIDKFSEKLTDQDWDEVTQNNDAQSSFTEFYTTYNKLYDECFPIKRVKLGYSTRKSWIPQNIKNLIITKNKMQIDYLKSKDPFLGIVYKRFRNKVNKLREKAERDHYNKLLNEHKHNLKKTWQILKEIINKNIKSSISSRFMVNNQIVINKQTIADGFNSFYVNVGPTLAKNIPTVNKSPCSFIKRSYNHLMHVDTVTSEEICKIIINLKLGSAGYDNISSKVFKSTAGPCIIPLTHICNLSIISGIFPMELKIAKVIPIFKSEDPLLFSNYRPVSVLPVISKVLERLMYNRLLKYLNKYDLIYSHQFGFRTKHSPNLALIYLMDKISTAMDEGKYVIGLFLDFKKAFDTVNHEILLQKLSYYGIKDISLKWFESYLDNRSQYVDYNGTKSKNMKISCGVPQGSILGPLLFLVYINDLPQVSKKLFALMFADDSNMFISGTNLTELINTVNEEMINVVEWLRVNKLSLNLKKTHFIIFSKGRPSIKINTSTRTNENTNNNNNETTKILFKPPLPADTKLIIDNVNVERKTCTKFLGVMLDERLSFQDHIKYIKGKIARGLGILYKSRTILNKQTLIQLYNSFLSPYLNYCITVWGNTLSTYLGPINSIQRRAVRVISNKTKRDDADPLFKELKILTFRELYAFNVQITMYKYYHGDLPKIFEPFFTFNRQLHQYETKSKHNLHTAIGRTNQLSSSIRVLGARSFNYFKDLIDITIHISTYKILLKSTIIDSGIEFLDVTA